MRILITGATGLIGSKITEYCRQRGIEVNYLTHNRSKIKEEPNFQGFYWNPQTGEIDVKCLEKVDAVINLAGANLFKIWTKSYKKELIDSRVDSLNLLFKTLKNNKHQVKQLVSASAIGIYPHSFQKIYDETDPQAANSFLGKLIQKWEKAAGQFSTIGIDVAILRTGMVLAKNGGALPIFKLSVNSYLGAPLGTGKQWQSWIHVSDVARIYLFAILQNLDGVYNAVSPNPVTNEEMTNAIAENLKKPLWLPKIPAPLLKLFMGQMATVALSSQLVESKKIQQMGFEFYYSNINKALEDLL